MPQRSTKKRAKETDEDENFANSMILGVTSEGECVYSHTFEDEVTALEFLETVAAGIRADILDKLIRRSFN